MGDDYCLWSEDADGQHHSACGHEFEFHSEPPHDWMKFCCYCGKPVMVQGYDELAEVSDDDT